MPDEFTDEEISNLRYERDTVRAQRDIYMMASRQYADTARKLLGTLHRVMEQLTDQGFINQIEGAKAMQLISEADQLLNPEKQTKGGNIQ